jgi:hypothetical protein
MTWEDILKKILFYYKGKFITKIFWVIKFYWLQNEFV